VSEGCQNCYARAIYERFGRDFSQVIKSHEKLGRSVQRAYPADGNKRGPGSKPICFVCDTGDLFHEAVSFGLIAEALYFMGIRSDVNWAILTKRPDNIPSDIVWPDNVWLGVTAENQARADERIPLLLATSAKVRFVSVEPMLEHMNLGEYLDGLSWVIAGAESGPHRRPFHKPWASALYAECLDAGVPFFFKQGSTLRPGSDATLGGHVIQEWPR
jgi:protein gp37